MPTTENQTGPPQATAAHARARTARLLAQLRRSTLAKITLAIGALWLLAALPLLLGQPPWPWFGFFRVAFTIAVFLLLVRLVHLLAIETLWLLRNRLILAYVFMGVVPVLLIAGMLAIGTYMFYGQYAAYLLVSELNDHTKNVGAVNTLTVRELERHPNRANDGPGLSDYYASYYFPRGFGGVHSYFYDAHGVPENPASGRFGPLSGWLSGNFLGLIARPNGYSIASFGIARAAEPERILTLYPLGARNLNTLAAPLGQISLGASGFINLEGSASALPAAPTPPAPLLASTLPLRPRGSVFDIRITAWAFIPVTDWQTGKQRNVIATITTRPSLLNDKLFASFQSGPNPSLASDWPLLLLGLIAVGFLIIEFFSLVAGIRLTRTITGAVNDLYIGTEHINRGEFGHRIPVRTRDQLAALEISFNNMSASIQRLLEEQRQKQRLESELSIAHEVQTQLFPRIPPVVAGLEIQGRCLPARVVSGDYYDFLQLSPSRVSLALGDISGKGISAALLMATIVSAVRAYQPGAADRVVGVAAGQAAPSRPAPAEDEADPARLLERLNRQLFHSTPPEKYATLFYAVYDGERRELRYTNAGHLPPVILGASGRRRLDRGGMVIGLFENVAFEEAVVRLEPGDLLAAWSDGITEPENEYGVEFGEPRLLQLLEANRHRPLADIVAAILDGVHDWSGAEEQADDITLLLARVT
ncbi:MAG TPA: PP2C family protein-serine/threonine phosphatase [Terriglobales bacterium]|nr:PP2C family protein-serine/threonine phosphatase [Terriglobales bacterium]